MAYDIRMAELGDMERIAALMTELHFEEGNDVVAQADDMVRALFADEREVQVHALVAVDAEQLVGAALYYPGYDTLSATYGHHLADIIVTKAMRGKGIGRLLVKALAQETLAQKKDWVSLTVLKRNDAAHEFYKALGMTQVSVHFFAAGNNALTQM